MYYSLIYIYHIYIFQCVWLPAKFAGLKVRPLTTLGMHLHASPEIDSGPLCRQSPFALRPVFDVKVFRTQAKRVWLFYLISIRNIEPIALWTNSLKAFLMHWITFTHHPLFLSLCFSHKHRTCQLRWYQRFIWLRPILANFVCFLKIILCNIKFLDMIMTKLMM